ncbi:TPA: flagellin [bacterium]|nr:flagellin [bacterium]
MAFTISNLSSLAAYRYLLRHNKTIVQSMEKLSSGYRINRASDDVTGYALTEKMTTRIMGLKQAEKNAQHAASLLREADSGMSSINEKLQDLRALAIRAASESANQRIATQKAVDQLVAEIDRLASATKFSNIQILKGIGRMDIHIGAGVDETIRISISSVDVNALGIRGLAVTGTANTNAEKAISSLDAALSIKIRARSQVGAYEARAERIISQLQISQMNMEAARSRIREVDFARETMALTRSQILQSAALAMLAQANLDARNISRLLY